MSNDETFVTRCANWRRVDQKDPDMIYVGRPRGSKVVWACRPGIDEGWAGNPHSVGYCATCNKGHLRAEALNYYAHYFQLRIEEDAVFKEEVLKLHGKVLCCFCLPTNRCHSEIMANWIDTYVASHKSAFAPGDNKEFELFDGKEDHDE